MMPYILLALLILLGIDLFFKTHNENVKIILEILDSAIIIIFIFDLILLFKESKDIRFFFKNYWLDIIAVLPFGLIFRTADSVLKIGLEVEKIVAGQKVVHELVKGEDLIKFFSRLLEKIKIFEFLGKFTKGFRFIPKTIKYIKKTDSFAKLHDIFYYNKLDYELPEKFRFKR